jgi:hypothetical protein
LEDGTDHYTERRELTAFGSASSGIIFDDSGEVWPAESAQLAQRLGRDADHSDIVANAVRYLGFVQVAAIRDVLSVRFEPSVVSHLAAVAAFYEIASRGPKCLILTYPGAIGDPDRCEIYNNVLEGLRRLEDAANRGRSATRPVWLQRRLDNRRHYPSLTTNLLKRKPPTAVSQSCAPQMKSHAGDRSLKLSRPLDAISVDDEWFRQLLKFWGSARKGRRLPSNESLDSLELLNLARGRAHIVETASSNSAGYRFRLWGAVNSYGGGYANRTLGEMPPGMMRDDAIEDYRQVVAVGAPSYQLIDLVEKTTSYSYARLLLPLAQDGRRVDRLIVLINERPLPEIDAP